MFNIRGTPANVQKIQQITILKNLSVTVSVRMHVQKIQQITILKNNSLLAPETPSVQKIQQITILKNRHQNYTTKRL